MAGKKTIIFDLDGTLIDSLEDIAVCMNQVLKELNLPIHEINDYKYFVGGGISILVENSLNALNQEISEELKENVRVSLMSDDDINELFTGYFKDQFKTKKISIAMETIKN